MNRLTLVACPETLATDISKRDKLYPVNLIGTQKKKKKKKKINKKKNKNKKKKEKN